MIYTSERLTLEELKPENLHDIHELHSIPAVDEHDTLGIPDSIQSTENLLNEWIREESAIPRISYHFCIRHRTTKQFIGLISLKYGKINFRNAETWYKIHPDFWNQGITTEVLKALLKFAFLELGLHRVEASCSVDNLASVRVLEKSGMTREGIKRRILPIRGNWVDSYLYSILESEFEL